MRRIENMETYGSIGFAVGFIAAYVFWKEIDRNLLMAFAVVMISAFVWPLFLLGIFNKLRKQRKNS